LAEQREQGDIGEDHQGAQCGGRGDGMADEEAPEQADQPRAGQGNPLRQQRGQAQVIPIDPAGSGPGEREKYQYQLGDEYEEEDGLHPAEIGDEGVPFRGCGDGSGWVIGNPPWGAGLESCYYNARLSAFYSMNTG